MALQGLMVKEDAHSASVVKVTPQIADKTPSKSLEGANNAAKDSGDDDDDIIAKALRYAGIMSPTSSMDCSLLRFLPCLRHQSAQMATTKYTRWIARIHLPTSKTVTSITMCLLRGA